jgi:drug/metabolite transporter (DMT)-like permease
MEQTHSRRPPAWQIILAFAALYVSWGTTYLAIREGVKDMPPALFGGVRLAAAGLLILLYQAIRGQSLRLGFRPFLWTVLCSTLLVSLGNYLLGVAEKSIESGTAAILGATTTLWLGLIERCTPRGERLTPLGWIGLLGGLAGVVLLVSPHLGDPMQMLANSGPLLMLGSAFSWACGISLVRRKPSNMPVLTAAGYQLFLGGMMLVVGGLLIGEGSQVTAESFTPRAIYSFLYLLVVGSLIGYVAFSLLLSHVSAMLVGTHSYVNPVVAVFVGWLLAGEQITLPIMGGMIVILVGVALVRLGTPAARTVIDRAVHGVRFSLATNAEQAENRADGQPAYGYRGSTKPPGAVAAMDCERGAARSVERP